MSLIGERLGASEPAKSAVFKTIIGSAIEAELLFTVYVRPPRNKLRVAAIPFALLDFHMAK